MNDTLTQQQQLNLIKAWVRKNRFLIVLPILSILTAYIGWNLWSNAQASHSERAANQFQTLINQSIPNNDDAQSIEILQSLSQSYADTPYASAARLSYAKALINSNAQENSIEHLLWVVNNEPVALVRELAATRLARLHIDLNQYDVALTFIEEQLGSLTKAGSLSRLYIIQSDAYLKQNKASAAKKSLEAAKKTLPSNSPLKDLIELKLNNIRNL